MSPFREGNGHPERRQHARRDDDVDPTTARGFEFWVRLMFLHKGKVFAAFGLASGIVGYLTGVLGVVKRVDRLEAAMVNTQGRIEALERSDQLKTYILCVLVSRTDPRAAPVACTTILQSEVKP